MVNPASGSSLDRNEEQGSEDIASVDFIAVAARQERRQGAKTGIASVDFIAVAAKGGSKLAGLTWRVSWLVAAE